MQEIKIMIEDSLADVLSVTAIGQNGDGTTNIVIRSLDLQTGQREFVVKREDKKS